MKARVGMRQDVDSKPRPRLSGNSAVHPILTLLKWKLLVMMIGVTMKLLFLLLSPLLMFQLLLVTAIVFVVATAAVVVVAAVAVVVVAAVAAAAVFPLRMESENPKMVKMKSTCFEAQLEHLKNPPTPSNQTLRLTIQHIQQRFELL